MHNINALLTSTMSELEAIERAKNGDVTGHEKLYDLYAKQVRSLCLRCTNNIFDADDLTQEVFIQVFRKIGTFRGAAKFRTWLYRIAMNFVRLYGRRQRRDARVIARAITEYTLRTTNSRPSNATQRLALRRALGVLTPARRKVFLLHDVEGLSHSETASLLQISVIASKSRLHQAHLSMRLEL